MTPAFLILLCPTHPLFRTHFLVLLPVPFQVQKAVLSALLLTRYKANIFSSPVSYFQSFFSNFKSLLNTVIMQEFSFCRKCFDLLFRRKHISIRLFCLKFQIFI